MLVHDADVPDPFLLAADGRFFAYATNAGGAHVQVLTSPDLLAWTPLGGAVAALPEWALPGRTWSPAVLATPDYLVLYAAVHERRSGRQAIATWTGDDPAGPFLPTPGGPLVFQRAHGGSIDPDPFVDSAGTPFLTWKSDDNALGGRAALWSRQLRPDGLGFVRTGLLGGRPSRLLVADRGGWERPLVEAPCLLPWEGRFLLLYSGGWWESPSYGVGWADGDSPTSAFHRRTPDRPWLTSSAEVAGPGGQSVVRGPDGHWWLGYHGWEPDRVGYRRGGRRALHVDRLLLGPDGPRVW